MNTNEFLKLVYAPPAYLSKLSHRELREDLSRITTLLYTCGNMFDADEYMQLVEYQKAYTEALQELEKNNTVRA